HDPLGDLDGGQAGRPAIFLQVFCSDVRALPEGHGGYHGLAPFGVWNTDDGGLDHRRMGVEHILDLRRRDVVAPPDDEVLFAVDDVQIPLVVELADVT